jgi:tRNA threonylcarbamoyladenosine biosynthesis protein TsaE
VTTRIELITKSADETRAIGERLGRLLRAGDVLLLHGDLGSGKTTLTQGIARGLGVEDYVQSPTFTLVAEHTGSTPCGTPLRLYHIDLYRLSGEEDLPSFGYEQYLAPVDGITVIEWPERAGSTLPDRYLLVTIEPIGPDTRRLELQPPTGEPTFDLALNRLCDESRV